MCFRETEECCCYSLYLGDMRDPQDEGEDAHDQDQQLFSLQELQNFGAKLIFYERNRDLNGTKLWHTNTFTLFVGGI